MKNRYVPKFGVAKLEMLLGYFLLFTLILITFTDWYANVNFSLKLILQLFISVFIGLTFHYIYQFMHAAGHYELSKNRVVNDILGNVMIGYIFLTPMEKYRTKHFLHHKLLGSKSDPEGIYHDKFNFREFINYLFLVRVLSKLHQIFSLNFEKTNLPIGLGALGSIARDVILFSTYHLAILYLFLHFSSIGNYVISWLIPFVSFFPAISYLRTILEHKSFSDENCVSRNFKFDLLGFFLGDAGFRYHYWHHQNMNIHYTNLKEYANDSKQAGPEPLSYFKLLCSNFRFSINRLSGTR